jgi:very-short-patch-repair endonuclease
MDTSRHELFELASRQYGFVAAHQAHRLGIDTRTLSRWQRGGLLVRHSHRVWRVGGAHETGAARAMAAVLESGPRSFLARRSALALWEMAGFSLVPLEVVTDHPERRRGLAEACLIRARDLPDELTSERHGIPVVRPELALFQLSAKVSYGRLLRLVDTAWAMRLVDGGALHRCYRLMKDRGRTGSANFRQMIEERPLDYRPPDSNLEARFERVIAQHGGEPMRRQVDSGGEGWSGRVDFRDAHRPLVVEIFSRRYHTSLSDIAHDEERLRELRNAGFVVIVFWDEQLFAHGYDVSAVVRRVRDALDGGMRFDDPWLAFTRTLHLDTADGSPIRAFLGAPVGNRPPTGDKIDLNKVDFDPNWGW